jgi:serine/tyrosine/threonine adenylyltransferase
MDSHDISPSTTQPTSATSGQEIRFGFDNTYARLPEHFYARLEPTPVAVPRLVKLNVALAWELGLDADALVNEQGIEILAGNRVAEGAEPVAMAYARHQFGQFVPQLQDFAPTEILGSMSGLPNTHPETSQLLSRARSFL